MAKTRKAAIKGGKTVRKSGAPRGGDKKKKKASAGASKS